MAAAAVVAGILLAITGRHACRPGSKHVNRRKKKPKPMFILLVEDNPAHAAAIQRAVEASGSESEVKVVGTLREFR